MTKSFLEVIRGFWSLVTGMRITLGQFFKPTVTVHYPHESLTMPPRFRGHIELIGDPASGEPLCVACKLCEKACPSTCIKVEGAKAEGAKKRTPTLFSLDFTKCSLCGSCVEACKSEALRFSREYNRVGVSKEEFLMDLLKRLSEQSKLQTSAAAPVETPEKPAAPASAPTAPAPAAPAQAGEEKKQ